METQSRNEVEAIFFEALERQSSADRDAFLREACGRNAKLRKEVDALIAAQQTPDTFLQQPVGEFALPAGSKIEEREGSQIGRYKLLEKLGEGGFGLVFMAEQTSPVRRRVALKIIKPGMDSKEVVARFEAERQALAMMDHPNIAKVLDGGTTDSGRPYFVMELVKGASITEYCDANRLNNQGRLELFRQVCRAIQHAHQKGIIHRDLKPTNVMVTLHDGVPVPKVIDFGVSKALSQPLTEKTLFTRYGQIVGTPQYMSPEQAEMSGLDVDTRSDVYSLGVLLYELLTGNPPFDAESLREAGFDGMRRIIREQEPVKPSTALSTLQEQAATLIASQRSLPPNALRQAVAGDLDWIAMRCLEKDRNRRYETANDLIRDIDRHFANEPIAAGPPSLIYQVRKLYQRNRVVATTAAAIAATLLLGVTATTVAWAQESAQRRIAVEQRQVAQAKAEQLQAATDKAEREAKRAKSTLEVLKSLVTKAAPNSETGTEVKVSQLLHAFAQDLQSVELEDPLVEIELRRTLAEAFARFSMTTEETQQHRLAEQLARSTFRKTSPELAEFLLWRASSVEPEGVRYLQEALTCLDNSEASKIIEVNIHRQLGFKLAWDRPVPARTHFDKACKLADKLSHNAKMRLDSNPYRDFADHLYEYFFEADLATAKNAHKMATRFGSTRDRVSTAMLNWKLAGHTDGAIYLKEARELAIGSRNGEGLATILNTQTHTLWLVALVPGFEQMATQMTDDILANWDLLYDKSVNLGCVWGTQIQLDNQEKAAQLEELIQRLPVPEQERCALHAAKRLRAAGLMKKAFDLYARCDATAPWTSWSLSERSRCHTAVRNLTASLPLLDAAVSNLDPASNETTNPNWKRFERATILEAAGRMKAAEEAYIGLIPDLVQAAKTDTHSGGMLIYCMAKSGKWNAVDEETRNDIETQIKDLETKEIGGIFGVLYSVTLAFLEEHRGNKSKYTDYLVRANQNRPGTFEQCHCEWIPEKIVELLTESGDIERLEEILRQDVQHRDESLPDYHPERAFTRIRLAETLQRHRHSKDEILSLLHEAKQVYRYHGDWIPAREHEKLDELIETVSA